MLCNMLSRVHVRVRGLEPHELRSAAPVLGLWGTFTVDAIHEGSQEDVFSAAVAPLVRDEFLQGSSCIFMCYGASQSGKSYTLEGPPVQVTAVNDGMVPRAVSLIFNKLEPVPKHRYQLLVSVCGLSAGPDAAMIDLLSSSGGVASLKDAAAGTAWGKIAKHQLTCHKDIYRVLVIARQAAARAAKPLHTCITLQLVGETAGGEQLRTSLSFCELVSPGSRDQLGRPAVTDSATSRSLSLGYAALTAVITALKQQAAAPPDGAMSPSLAAALGMTAPSRALRVPWRDTPLTRWLQQPMSRATQLVVMAHVSPAPQAASDTLATLSFVSKLRSGGRNDGVVVTASWAHGSQASISARSTPARSAADEAQLAQSGSEAAPSWLTPLTANRTMFAAAPSSPNVSQWIHSQQDTVSAAHTPGGAFSFGPSPSGDAPRSTGHISPSPQLSSAHHKALSKVQGLTLDSPGVSPRGAASGNSSPSLSSFNMQHSSKAASCYTPAAVTGKSMSPRTGASMKALDTLDKGNPDSPPERQHLPVPPTLTPSKSSQQNNLSAYLEVLKALRQGNTANRSHAEAQLELLYEAAMARSALALQDGPLGTTRQLGEVGTAALEQIIHSLRQQLAQAQEQVARHDKERGAFTQELQRLGEVSVNATQELERQATEAGLQHQVAVLKDQLFARSSALEDTMLQLATTKQEAESLRAAHERAEKQAHESKQLAEQLCVSRDELVDQLEDAKREACDARAACEKAEKQLHGAVDKLQAQVVSLTEEAVRMKRRAAESAAELEVEHTARRSVESQLVSVQEQVDSKTNYAAVVQQQLEALQQQLEDAHELLEQARTERSLMQEAKWAAEEQVQQLKAQLERTSTAAQQAERESRAVIERAQADARTAVSNAAVLQTNLNNANTAIQTLKGQVSQLQSTLEEQKRLESSAARDLKDVDAMLREFEHELEVHAQSLWRDMRTERCDVMLLAPDRAALATSSRWKPILRTLTSVLRKHMADHSHLAQTCEQLSQQLKLTQHKTSQVEELSANLHAQQAARLETLNELNECKAQLAAMATIHADVSSLRQSCQRLQSDLQHKEEALLSLHEECQKLSGLASKTQGLTHKVQTRDHMFALVWGELLNMRASLKVTQRTRAMRKHVAQIGYGDTASVADADAKPGSLIQLLQQPQVVEEEEDSSPLDWSDPGAQQRIISLVSHMRVQVSALIAELLQSQQAHEEQTCARVQAAVHQVQSVLGSEVESLRQQLEASEAKACEYLRQVQGLEVTEADLKESLAQLAGELAQAKQQAKEKGEQVEELSVSHTSLKRELSDAQEELVSTRVARDALKAEKQLFEEAARAKSQLELDLMNSGARVKQLESQLKDVQQQVSVTSSRLAATENALQASCSRVSELNSKLDLAATDHNIQVEDLTNKLAEAEKALGAARVRHDEAVGKLTSELEEVSRQLQELTEEAQGAREDKTRAEEAAEVAGRQVREAEVRLQDADFVRSQLQGVMAERDDLQDQVHQLRTAHLSAAQECTTLRQEVDVLRQEVARSGNERLHLAAQLEAAKLESVVNNALARNKSAMNGPGRSSPRNSPRNSRTAIDLFATSLMSPSKSSAGGATPSSAMNLSQLAADLRRAVPGMTTPGKLSTPGPAGNSGTSAAKAALVSAGLTPIGSTGWQSQLGTPYNSALVVPHLIGVSGSASRVPAAASPSSIAKTT